MNFYLSTYVDTDDIADGIKFDKETEFLTDIFAKFNPDSVIEAYEAIQKKYPSYFPPLQEREED